MFCTWLWHHRYAAAGDINTQPKQGRQARPMSRLGILLCLWSTNSWEIDFFHFNCILFVIIIILIPFITNFQWNQILFNSNYKLFKFWGFSIATFQAKQLEEWLPFCHFCLLLKTSSFSSKIMSKHVNMLMKDWPRLL